jgi:hypothetical protein
LKEAFALAATLAFIVAGGVVGARLLLMARRTRQTAELCLGLALFSIAGLAYPLILAAGVDPTGVKRGVSAAGVALLCFGWSCYWLFTWTTFRRESAIARAITFLAIAAGAFFTGWRIVRLATEDAAILQGPSLDGLGTLVLAMVVYLWTSIESFRYGAMLKRRVRLGLADPTVANRFLLWGLMGVSSFLSLVVPLGAPFLPRTPEIVTLSRLTVGVAGTACATLLYLAFLAPRSYLDWVRRRAAAAA